MHLDLAFGLKRIGVEIADERLLPVKRQQPPEPLTDLPAALRSALEHPLDYPPLRRALTPDDHVAILVDEGLAQLPVLLPPLLEHIVQAGVRPEAITLLCTPPATEQAWIDSLPEQFQAVRVEVHDPKERKHLAYLATTKKGHRIYLNRTAVDADQLVVLTRRHYDCLLGYAGAEGDIHPGLADEATIRSVSDNLSLGVPGEKPWPLRAEAEEIAWLLGTPFLVQVIEGPGDAVAHITGGVASSSAAGRQLLDAVWRVAVPQQVEMVLGTISGDPERQGLGDIARALACCARVVQDGGRIVLLTDIALDLTTVADDLERADSPTEAWQILEGAGLLSRVEAMQWASAASRAKIYLLSHLLDEEAESVFLIPLQTPAQVQRALQATGTCVVLPDAQRTLAVVEAAS